MDEMTTGAAGETTGGAGETTGGAGETTGAAGEKTGGAGETTGGAGEKTGGAGEKTGAAGEKTGGAGEKTGAAGKKTGAAGVFERRQWAFELVYILFFGFICFLWACQKDMHYNPDEFMRAQVPWYIYHHGVLPNGWEPELRDVNWGFSYAFHPTFLPAIIGSTLMRLVDLVHATRYSRMVALRMTNILAGMGCVFMLFRIGGRLFETRLKWVMTVFISMIPQFVYLSSYYNCDMLCLLGSLVVCYSWIRVLQEGWGYVNALILSVGMSVIALSYFNGYGWILLSIFFFFLTPVLGTDPGMDRKKMRRLFFYIVGLVFVMTGFFFIRNLVIYDGFDLFGSKAMAAAGELYAVPALKPSATVSLYEDGLTLAEMFTRWEWSYPTQVMESFIGSFGYLMYDVPEWIFEFYKFAFGFGGIGFVCAIVSAVKSRRSKFEERSIGLKKSVFLYVLLWLAFLIVFGLHTYYSYMKDYQFQGRYMYPAMPALVVVWATGIDYLTKHPKTAAALFCCLCVTAAVTAYFTAFMLGDVIIWLR